MEKLFLARSLRVEEVVCLEAYIHGPSARFLRPDIKTVFRLAQDQTHLRKGFVERTHIPFGIWEEPVFTGMREMERCNQFEKDIDIALTNRATLEMCQYYDMPLRLNQLLEEFGIPL
jgi:hypothetical protein